MLEPLFAVDPQEAGAGLAAAQLQGRGGDLDLDPDPVTRRWSAPVPCGVRRLRRSEG